jgi:hypothetical protein
LLLRRRQLGLARADLQSSLIDLLLVDQALLEQGLGALEVLLVVLELHFLVGDLALLAFEIRALDIDLRLQQRVIQFGDQLALCDDGVEVGVWSPRRSS